MGKGPSTFRWTAALTNRTGTTIAPDLRPVAWNVLLYPEELARRQSIALESCHRFEPPSGVSGAVPKG